MLRLVMEEWGKEESILFKCYNKYKEIYNEDSSIIKKDKEKHNALYQLYFNIINIAILYRIKEYYFPVFA